MRITAEDISPRMRDLPEMKAAVFHVEGERGSGKSLVASAIMAAALQQGGSVLVVSEGRRITLETRNYVATGPDPDPDILRGRHFNTVIFDGVRPPKGLPHRRLSIEEFLK